MADRRADEPDPNVNFNISALERQRVTALSAKIGIYNAQPCHKNEDNRYDQKNRGG
ncbi:hypothetical protein BN873_30021 [Candidatus Competibacter denitrificans Run_A_D11]|uniref:Uncharacterized protein n=1 Tax=Candidatus Competibacter denitrificans Run_A_D11 TaxID=1400863 RepID=W6M3V7_9GAMM|nr:hypothetical protein BN873_30021 [Candidatus Competibacter denitrificans Run_A_D11]